MPDVDEELGQYWECLRGIDQKKWYLKEAYLRRDLGSRNVDDTGFHNLRTSQRAKKFISSDPNYDILMNFRYADAFFYTPLSMRVENTSSDYISKIIYMGEDTTKQ